MPESFDMGATVRVVELPWSDAMSQSVVLESPSGARVTAFAYAEGFRRGEQTQVELEPLDALSSFEEAFSGNPDRESGFEVLAGEWNYLAKGRVADLVDGEMEVDVGGFLLLLDGYTNDTRVVGEWVGVRVERLDAYRPHLYSYLQGYGAGLSPLSAFAKFAALDRFGELTPACLPGHAAQLLLEGVESESLVLLAGAATAAPPCDLTEAYYAALAELALDLPSAHDGAYICRDHLLDSIAGGDLEVQAGRTKLDRLTWLAEEEFRHACTGFLPSTLSRLSRKLDALTLRDSAPRPSVLEQVEQAYRAECARLLGNAP